MTPAVLERTAPLMQPAPAVTVRHLPHRNRGGPRSAAIAHRPFTIPSAKPDFARDVGYEREVIADSDELGRQITTSAISGMPHSFAVGCRSASQATRFATPMRSLLLTLGSGFEGISATVAPNLLLHTYPAMEALVRSLESTGSYAPWQPVGERSIGLGSAKHLFVSQDTPMPEDAQNCMPNTLLEVVGAHLIPARWFDQAVAPKCDLNKLTIVCYGMVGVKDSLFERSWGDCQTRGLLGNRP